MHGFKYTATSWERALSSFCNANGTNTSDGKIGNGTTYIIVFKGDPPTASTSVDHTYLWSTRHSDKLVVWNGLGQVEAITGNTIQFKTLPFTAASNTGTATWFSCHNSSGTHAIWGDVSDLSGLGFLKIPDVNLVKNQKYNLERMKIMVPYEMLRG